MRRPGIHLIGMIIRCLLIAGFMGSAFSQNPISPAGMYIADPSAHVWHDGRLFVYGSLDETCGHYCSHRYHVMETSDMVTWIIHENRFASKGEGDQIACNDDLLFAPDCAFIKDTFYLYYCQPGKSSAEGVAVSTDPSGPFTGGRNIDLAGYNQIDPSLFLDEDGQAYYLWGQFTLKMAEMKPGMRELDLTTIRDSILTEGQHYFHEGAFMAKRNGIYYLVYTDISRSDMPTCIGYSMAKSPFGPYTYGGVIIDNDHCNPGNWNNHGSIVEFKDQWYVFYHRSTHGCNKMRKACVEKIFFHEDGTIPEVEMTSHGASGPLPANSRIEAEWACMLQGNVRIRSDEGNREELTEMKHGDKAVYKDIDFGAGVKGIRLRIKSGSSGGKILITIDMPWYDRLAVVPVDPSGADHEWKDLSFEIKPVDGVHAVWLQFTGEGNDLFSIDRFTFY